MTPAMQAVVDRLDEAAYAMNLTALIELCPEHSVDDLKSATRQLYEDRAINRVSVKAPNGSYYYVFYSLYVRTVNVYRDEQAPPPVQRSALALALEPVREVIPTAPAAPEPAAEPELTLDMAQTLIARLEADLAPPVVERRVVERRKVGALDVIRQWKLDYFLSRVIEIVSGARKTKLSRADAALVIKLVRQHIKGDE